VAVYAPERPVILGLETSCDETSAAVLDGDRLQSLVILSQDAHAVFGGVVPEIAARAHVTSIVPVVRRALSDAHIELADLTAIAVTNAPGLIGALLVGLSYAKGLAAALGRPLVAVHHMEGHLFAASLEHPEAVPPFTALLVSGGHTMLIDVAAWGEYRLLGATRDDAAGEAFDKVAKMLGLPYPGGRHIERLAATGDPTCRSAASRPPCGWRYQIMRRRTSPAGSRMPSSTHSWKRPRALRARTTETAWCSAVEWRVMPRS